MIGALSRHFWLFVTFRHDGSGLPARRGVAAWLVLSLAILVSMLVYGVPIGIFSGVVLILASAVSVPCAVAIAILSAGMDLMDVLFFVLSGLRTGAAGDMLEMFAGWVVTFRILKPKPKA